MDDLQLAEQQLKFRNLNLVFVKDGQIIFERKEDGLNGFLQAIKESADVLAGAAVADRIVGKATALLSIYSKVRAVFAVIISKKGLEILEQYNMPCKYEKMVPTILNHHQTDKCPFEKLVENISDPQTAYTEIRHFCNSKRKSR